MALLRHLSALVTLPLAALTLLAATPGPVTAQPAAPATPGPGPATYTIFLKGQQIGREEATLSKTPDGWRITSTSRMSVGSIHAETQLFEVRYAPDWQPIELRIESVVNGQKRALHTSFTLTTATSEITQGDTTNQKTDTISARAVVLPNNYYAGYEALAARLTTVAKDETLPAYVAPQMEVRLHVDDIIPEQIQTTGGNLAVRRYRLTFQNPGLPLAAEMWVDERGRMARLEVPAATLQIVREELATAMTRFEEVTHPGDEVATIPATGFNLAATVTRPVGQQQRLRFPAVILVAGAGPHDRNQTVFGIPIFGQVANALADAGFLVVRYDKRGVGQSGGRGESATIGDFAEDLRSVLRYTRRRKDVDPRRVAVLGHSEGAAVALLAARKNKDIAGLVLVAGPGTTGEELVLEQQQRLLGRAKITDQERQAKLDLQHKIHDAVLRNRGWADIPPEIRQLADSPWFQSVLAFDPARAMRDTRQPILIVQGTLDTQVPPHHADKLAELARARKHDGGVDVKLIEGVNHLLVPAKTGEFDEYADLEDKQVGQPVLDAIREWLRTTL
jgi:uncharacterized protein